ncbi:MAG: hypothetical protein ABW170_06905 [Candidatus Thiodiazotropha sp. L084R]
MLALYPLWRKARRVYSLTSRLPGTNRLGFQPSLALSDRVLDKRVYIYLIADGRRDLRTLLLHRLLST